MIDEWREGRGREKVRGSDSGREGMREGEGGMKIDREERDRGRKG